MKEYRLQDIIGPIMIGPSSSHTAGACRIGYTARRILNRSLDEIRSVTFLLFGSFAKTYRGHGTDIALLGGFLGLAPDDERLVDAYALAEERGLRYRFELSEEEGIHPNAVTITVETTTAPWEITGVSIGGGKMVIRSINGIDVQYTGDFNTLITHHRDSAGMLMRITTVLAKRDINIAFMKLYREEKGIKAIGLIETDESIAPEVRDELMQIDGMLYVNLIDRIA